MWKCEGLEEVSSILILFQGILGRYCSLVVLLSGGRESRNLKSVSLECGVRDVSSGRWIGKQSCFFFKLVKKN